MSGDMADPLPENISGEKSVVHHHEHGFSWDFKVNISHVILAAAIFAVAYVLHQKLNDGGTEQEDSAAIEDGTEVEIGGQAGLVN